MTIQEQGFAPQPNHGPEPVETISLTITGPRDLIDQFGSDLDMAYEQVLITLKHLSSREQGLVQIKGDY